MLTLVNDTGFLSSLLIPYPALNDTLDWFQCDQIWQNLTLLQNYKVFGNFEVLFN